MLDVSRYFLTEEQMTEGWRVIENEEFVWLKMPALMELNRYGAMTGWYCYRSTTATKEIVQKAIKGE